MLASNAFKPHVALKSLLEWFRHNGPNQVACNAAFRAQSIYSIHALEANQSSLFNEYDL
jgi:hypothetical protein